MRVLKETLIGPNFFGVVKIKGTKMSKDVSRKSGKLVEESERGSIRAIHTLMKHLIPRSKICARCCIDFTSA
jgi:hypothetical protein